MGGGRASSSDVSPLLREEIAHFFTIYKDLEPDRITAIEGWARRADARGGDRGRPRPLRRAGRRPRVNDDRLKLTTYFGERDRVDGRFLADAMLDLYGHHEIETSILLRGAEGFGLKHHLHTDRLLTLSEDLPVVSVAVDARERIESVLPEVEAIKWPGLVTLERARLLSGG